MKTFDIEVLRRNSQFAEWSVNSIARIRAKNYENALKQFEKMYKPNPYQIHGKITEVTK